MAASLAPVSWPRSCAASAAEVACGIRPPSIEISLPASRALGAQVPPVQRLESLRGQIPQPEEKRHGRRLPEILRQSPRGLQARVLDHVGGINSPLEPAVHAQRHHPPQPLAVLRQHRAHAAPSPRAAASSRRVLSPSSSSRADSIAPIIL